MAMSKRVRLRIRRNRIAKQTRKILKNIDATQRAAWGIEAQRETAHNMLKIIERYRKETK